MAVLPVDNLSGEPADEYFVDGLTEQIISNLAQIEGVRVLARTTTRGYRDNPGRVAEIARDLQAGTVLEGSARRSEEKLRIHVQLIDGESEEHLWTGEFDRSLDDYFVIQSEIATRVAEALESTINPGRLARIRRGPTGDPSAFDLYLRGRSAYRQQTRVGNEEAIEFYKRALSLDPEFALAEAGLANAYAQRVMRYGLPKESEELAVAAARRALALNAELPEAFKALGIVAMRQDRFREAIGWNEKALEFNPSYDEAIYNLSSVLHASGRWDEALRMQLRETDVRGGLPAVAAQMLRLGFVGQGAAVAEAAFRAEPHPAFLNAQLARHHARREDFDSARRRVAALRRAHPDWAGSWGASGEIEWLAGDYQAAAAFFVEAHRVWGGDEPEPLVNVARSLWILGERDAAERRFAQIETRLGPMIESGSEYWFHYWAMAAIESMRGEGVAAVDWYRRAVDMGHRSGWLDEIDPTFGAIQGNPEFERQLRRIQESIVEMQEAVRSEVDASLERLVGA
ncbi:MAG: tetratricopeptide repeat protein [Thermoanaerobaculia bacterium]